MINDHRLKDHRLSYFGYPKYDAAAGGRSLKERYGRTQGHALLLKCIAASKKVQRALHTPGPSALFSRLRNQGNAQGEPRVGKVIRFFPFHWFKKPLFPSLHGWEGEIKKKQGSIHARL